MTARFVDEWLHFRRPVVMDDDAVILTRGVTAHWEGWKIHVSEGYVTDGASIKTRMARFVIGHPWGEYLAAAVIHDVLYEAEAFSRADCDRAFRDLMAVTNVGLLKRTAMYAAVRVGGWYPWSQHTDATRAVAWSCLTLSKLEDDPHG